MKHWDPDSSHVRIGLAARQHLSMYSELHSEAKRLNDDTVFWKLYPKHHVFVHCAEDQIESHGNPSDHWCYGDESEIG
eukprot:1721718-Pyramimonas_sp.AAC.1